MSRGVFQLDLGLNFIAEYRSMKDAVEQTGVNYGSICSCCRGQISKAFGFVWRYDNRYIKKPQTEPLDKLLFIDYDDGDDSVLILEELIFAPIINRFGRNTYGIY